VKFLQFVSSSKKGDTSAYCKRLSEDLKSRDIAREKKDVGDGMENPGIEEDLKSWDIAREKKDVGDG